MTKRDYDLIAETLRDRKPVAHEPIKPGTYEFGRATQWETMVLLFAERLGQANPKFQPLKFYHACGYEAV